MTPKPVKKEIHSAEISFTSPEAQAATVATVSELLFILLPFFVIVPVYAYLHRAREIPWHPEWSIASAVLFGQTIIKLLRVARVGNSQMAGLYAALAIAPGLVFSIAILVIMESEEQSLQPPPWLAVTQGVWFLVAVVYFSFIRWIGEYLERLKRDVAPGG